MRRTIRKDKRNMNKSTMKDLYTTKVEMLSIIMIGDNRENLGEVLKKLRMWKRDTTKWQIPFETNKGRDRDKVSACLFRMPRDMEVGDEGHRGVMIVNISKFTITKKPSGIGEAKVLDIVLIFEKTILTM